MTKQKGHVLGLSCHLKPGRASQNPRGPYRNEPQTSLNRAATGVSAGLSIRLQVSEMLEQPVLEGASSRSPWTPCTPLYKKQSTPDVLVKARAKRTALRTNAAASGRQKGSLPPAQCHGMRADTQAIASSSFSPFCIKQENGSIGLTVLS